MTHQRFTTTLDSEQATLEFGAALAKTLKQGVIVFLDGPLGAGKTTLTRGLLRGFGYEDKVKSPTYTLVEPYHLANNTIFHFDLYRLRDPEELEHMGARDYFTSEAICIIEWPEKGQAYLPTPDMICHLAINGDSRLIQLESHSVRGDHIIQIITTTR